ncbi:MAG: hypothetical protein OEY28_12925 [Nitrospira sp.]|nr:hypothetical protein [Nitrospira sp.]
MPSSRSRFRPVWIVFAACLAWVSVTTSGCGVEQFLEAESQSSGPQARQPKRASVICYESFRKLKAELGGAGDGMQWHHIVGQHAANESKFGSHDLNCTDNVISLPTATHQKINGHYASKPAFAMGKTVRDWLAPQSFDKQYEYGMGILRDNGIEP